MENPFRWFGFVVKFYNMKFQKVFEMLFIEYVLFTRLFTLLGVMNMIKSSTHKNEFQAMMMSPPPYDIVCPPSFVSHSFDAQTNRFNCRIC